MKKENLRDNMTNIELALNLLAEVSTTELARMQKPIGYDETKDVTISGGEIANLSSKSRYAARTIPKKYFTKGSASSHPSCHPSCERFNAS